MRTTLDEPLDEPTALTLTYKNDGPLFWLIKLTPVLFNSLNQMKFHLPFRVERMFGER